MTGVDGMDVSEREQALAKAEAVERGAAAIRELPAMATVYEIARAVLDAVPPPTRGAVDDE